MYFSLNNRRLFLFKYLREHGLLESSDPPNTIYVRGKLSRFIAE